MTCLCLSVNTLSTAHIYDSFRQMYVAGDAMMTKALCLDCAVTNLV